MWYRWYAIKKVLVALAVTLVMCAAVSGICAITSDAKQVNPIKIWWQNDNGTMTTYVVVDEDTGVNYICVSGEAHSNPVGSSITPRLNSDGSIYISRRK